ncbi:MAG: hypothetical protein KME64_21035 [Scytonematopsis contorta HA4267-MV1]|jgi:hypothetical protein|nr:hypothetical protein [Scytonematopsis contorta HA4267-MV1]
MILRILLLISASLITGLIILILIQTKNTKEIETIWQSLEPAVTQKHFSKEMIAELPQPVQRYFRHAIAPDTPLASSVTLKMQGNFRTKQDNPWLQMQGQERITASKGFVWKAVIGSGLMQIKGADYYLNSLGRMQFSLWGLLPIVNVHNSNTIRSSIGRLAAEFIWLPSALLPQQGVQWKAIDNNTIQAILKIDGEPITLTLIINPEGKLLQITLPRWGQSTDNLPWTYIPFGGKCSDEATFGGYTIPSQTGVGWWIDTDRYSEFFRATIEEAEFR